MIEFKNVYTPERIESVSHDKKNYRHDSHVQIALFPSEPLSRDEIRVICDYLEAEFASSGLCFDYGEKSLGQSNGIAHDESLPGQALTPYDVSVARDLTEETSGSLPHYPYEYAITFLCTQRKHYTLLPAILRWALRRHMFIGSFRGDKSYTEGYHYYNSPVTGGMFWENIALAQMWYGPDK